MITRTLEEVVFSAFIALIFGGGFSILICLLDILLDSLSLLPKFARESFFFCRILPPPSFSLLGINRQRGPFYILVSFLIFAAGFSLASYITLDGEIRVYMLILSFASFYLAKIALFDFLRKAFIRLLGILLSGLSVVLRCAILPIKLIFSFVKKAQNKQ